MNEGTLKKKQPVPASNREAPSGERRVCEAGRSASKGRSAHAQQAGEGGRRDRKESKCHEGRSVQTKQARG